MREINLSKDAEKFLKKLPSKHRRQVVERILGLSENPLALDTSKLRGYDDYHRADIGEYRIIYRFSRAIILVTLLGKRNDDEVYRRFKRSGK